MVSIGISNQPQNNPRFDKKYDSIDWQDDNPSKNLSVEEMDKILDEKEQDNSINDDTDSGQDNSSYENSSDEGTSGGDNSGGDDGDNN